MSPQVVSTWVVYSENYREPDPGLSPLVTLTKKVSVAILVSTFTLSALLFVGGSFLQGYSVTVPQFLPVNTNSTVVFKPEDESMEGFFRGGTYRVTVDVNDTIFFAMFRALSNAIGGGPGFCNMTGPVVFQRESAKLNETFTLPLGKYAYIVCHPGKLVSFGTFQLYSYENVTTRPLYNLGSSAQAIAFPILLWGILLAIERASRRSSVVQYLRLFRWLIAPILFIFILGAVDSARFFDSKSQHVDYLFLLGEAPYLVANSTWLFEHTLPSLILLSFVMPPLLVGSLTLLYYLRRLTGESSVPSGRTKRFLISFVDNKIVRRLSSLILPENSHIGVFVRLALLTLTILETTYVAPIDFLRQLTPVIGPLIPLNLLPSQILTLFFVGWISSVGIFAYSMKWKPSHDNSLFRLIALAFTTLGLASISVIVAITLQSVQYVTTIIALTTIFLLPTMISGYANWIVMCVVRVVAMRTFRKLHEQ